jgi:hypothetical protein
MRFQKHFSIAAIFLFASTALFAAQKSGIAIIELTNRLRIEINGKLFTEYYFKDVPRPFCYPLIGPGELPLTRNFPMQNIPGEDHDHPHHRSLWFTHGSVNGIDFWSETPNAGKIVHEKFLQTKSGAKDGVIKSRNNWIDAKGVLVCEDERTLRVYNSKENSPRMLDFEITLHASKTNALVFGDTKEGSMAVRVAKSMQLLHGDGHIVMSTGVRDGETWGERADWCDYYGPVNGKTVGIAIFDHPKNPRHPTWWHVRDYGLFAANPFGVHDFEKKPKGEGDLIIPAGKSVTFRYRLILHEGDEKQSGLQKLYDDYSKK